MPQAQLTVDRDFAIGPVNRRLFGSFVEHMGRCVYTGIYEPGHPAADENGFRTDVLELAREMGVSVVRYPGGNFVSGYRWEDGVGPDRPTRLDLAWRQIETNKFGLNEFMTWTKAAQVEPMMAVNLGTRGLQEACDLLEYANHPSGTQWSDLRIKHGVTQPYDIRLWCLGNEMDGPWQIGHKSAEEYGRLANETARAMRLVDPRVELVLCGSSNSGMATFGSWEATVLEHAYDAVDYLSMHAYYEENGDLPGFLCSAVDMDRFISGVVATADHVAAKQRKRKQINLSFDEWNVWNFSQFKGIAQAPFEEAPRLIEDTYTAADAVVVGDFLITLLRHADRVSIACQAQLANIIAPIRTEPGGVAWRQTIFHPFALTAEHARGTVLRVEPKSPMLETGRYGEAPALSAVATTDGDSLAVFAVNRSPGEALDLSARVPGLSGPMRALVIEAGDDPHRVEVTPKPLDVVVDGDTLRTRLPAASWAVILND
ncbi:alpha-N-arabinofuranosidase [Nonomuraea sp. K274]|uniref:non-reducing end alpha-L-arabinofuranosidase n=1 Tax=Nonomuraea cypriaca TaxID=1187855 RepID=A0A931AHF6_9ACTN|nr:alpha-N-arabinofuranosidase [Nonomuraea cypriaca]MBF8190195.1 alpha-N-arabinofuranosidase [Nonomuraea cypriaca]